MRRSDINNFLDKFWVFFILMSAAFYGSVFLVFGISSNSDFFPILSVLILTIVLGEIIFFRLEDQPSEHDNVLRFTIKQKLNVLLLTYPISLLLVGGVCVVHYVIGKVLEDLAGVIAFAQTIGFYIGCVAVVCLAVYLYFRLNSLKYRKIKTKRRENNE